MQPPPGGFPPPSGGPAGPPPGGPPGAPPAFGGQPPQPPGSGSSGKGKKIALIGGAVVAAAALVTAGVLVVPQLTGGGADGASSGAAEALPAETFAYAGLDTSDASVEDVLEAGRRFPALQDALGMIGEDGDYKAKLFEYLREESGEDLCGLTWEDDFGWVGDSVAFAGVQLEEGNKIPVLAIESSDSGAAEETIQAIIECEGGDDTGYHVTDGWVLLGDDSDDLADVAEAAGEESLADTDGFQDRTGDLGDLGQLTMYASPEAPAILASTVEEATDMAEDLTGLRRYDDYEDSDEFDEFGSSSDPFAQFCPAMSDPTAMQEYSEQQLENFNGAAMTLRVSSEGVEVQGVSDNGTEAPVGSSAGELVGSLPEDTAAAVGFSLGEGWVDETLSAMEAMCGEDFDPEAIMSDLSQMSGLDLPADLETLTGDAVAFSVGSDLAAMAGMDPSRAPVGAVIQGDADEISGVLDKINGIIEDFGGDPEGMLDHDAEGDKVAVGPNPEYRSQVLSEDGLGDSDTFQNVVENPDEAASVLFLDFNQVDPFLGGMGAPSEVTESVAVLDGLGMSAWADGTTAHTVLKLGFDEE